ncbi:hypothetical protein AAVH_24775 [Aphelenchoides avenae]|nr:hypothetical protein AAVH_24775 [Aphelenchus avenae]
MTCPPNWTNGYKYEGVAGRIFSLPTCFGAPGLLRLYHGGLNDHFYTASAQEATQFISLGYKEEGFIGCVSKYKCPGMAPLYRAYHDGAGDHFYTMSAAEKDAAVNKDGYKDEGISAWIFPA